MTSRQVCEIKNLLKEADLEGLPALIKEFEEDELQVQKPLNYPDYDYRSIRYRVSLVPDTIERAKKLIDYFYDRINMSLGY